MTASRPPVTRAEIERPYRHPYRTWLPDVWADANAHLTVGAGAAATAIGGGATAATDQPLWMALGGIVGACALIDWGRTTVQAAVTIRRHARVWDQRSELADVRARRPHAGERDPELAHDEFAVTVEDTGHLYVWRFRPLATDEQVPAREILVPGRPSYAADVVEEHPFDRDDAARAAAQLADAQERAAAHERLARDEAVRAAQRHAEELEAAEETAVTAAALRHLTGQSRDR